MELPIEIRTIAEEALSAYNIHGIKAVSKDITKKYKEKSGAGNHLIVSPVEAAVYSVVRMPSTFGAVYSALSHTMECVPFDGEYSLLDVGAGTGAGTIAASQLLELTGITCIEREKSMRELGIKYTGQYSLTASKTIWRNGDIISGLNDRADVVLSSYVLNEMTEQDRIAAVRDMWSHTDKLLLIIEPGTPEAFSQLRRIRSELLSLGAHISAPCTCEDECRLEDDDWCHFTVRVQRSRLHRMIKEADVPYEDEKFCYMSFVKDNVSDRSRKRVLRHPQIGKGNITLTVCSNGKSEKITVTKKDKEKFRTARKTGSGDLF